MRTTEPSNAWIKPFEGTLPSWQANFQSRGFKKLVNVKWRSCSMSKQNLPYPFKLSLSLVKVIKPNAKLIQLKLNKTYVEKFENEILLRCAWTKETRSLILNAIIKCVNFLRLVRVKYQTRAFKFSMHHLHNIQTITSKTTACLLISLALVSKYNGTFSSRFWPQSRRWSRGAAVRIRLTWGTANEDPIF